MVNTFDGPWCSCMECMQLEVHDRAPARHDDDCECYHCWTGEDQAESLADGGDGRKPRTVVPHG